MEREASPWLSEACPPSLRPSAVDALPSPQYDDLQAAIVNCHFEEEVRLRSRLVLLIARKINQKAHATPADLPDSGAPGGSGAAAGDTASRKAPNPLRPSAVRLMESLRRRTLFVTKDGFLGMGAVGVTDIRMGDEVVMTEHSNMPLVLRPTEDPRFHEHVGFACVKGLVDGGFHKLKEHEKPERKVYKIR
jgi:hypothetical protein